MISSSRPYGLHSKTLSQRYLIKKQNKFLMWWPVPVVSACGRLRQEVYEFKAGQDCMAKTVLN